MREVDLATVLPFDDVESLFLQDREVFIQAQINKDLFEFDEVADIIFHFLFLNEIVADFGAEPFLVLAETLLDYVVLAYQPVGRVKLYMGGFAAPLGLHCHWLLIWQL